MFTDDALPGLADGTTSVTFRNWKRPQAKVGGQFRKRDLWFEVDAVTVITLGSITEADAERAGEREVAGKRLGLTLSLEVGYGLSPRGRAYLDRRT